MDNQKKNKKLKSSLVAVCLDVHLFTFPVPDPHTSLLSLRSSSSLPSSTNTRRLLARYKITATLSQTRIHQEEKTMARMEMRTREAPMEWEREQDRNLPNIFSNPQLPAYQTTTPAISNGQQQKPFGFGASVQRGSSFSSNRKIPCC